MFKRKTGDPIFQEAIKAFDQDNYHKAVELIEKAIKSGIKSYDLALVYATYGYYLTKIERLEEALNAHKKAIELNPKNPVAWRYYGMALRQQGDFDTAEQCYEYALAIDPKDELTQASLGALYIFRNKPLKTIEILAPYAEQGAQAAISMSNLALAYGMVGNFEAAEDSLGKAVQKGYPRWKYLQSRLDDMRSFRSSLRLEDEKSWLPPNCPKCGAPIHLDSVQWISKNSALCGYCGSTVKK